jgi:hypothetical protein
MLNRAVIRKNEWICKNFPYMGQLIGVRIHVGIEYDLLARKSDQDL